MNDQVNLTYPFGLYDDSDDYDTHYWVPFGKAIEIGFSEREAAIYANASGQVDKKHNPFLPSNCSYHFSTNQQAWGMVDSASSLEELGTAVHPLINHILSRPDKFRPDSPRGSMMMREVERALLRYYNSVRPRQVSR